MQSEAGAQWNIAYDKSQDAFELYCLDKL